MGANLSQYLLEELCKLPDTETCWNASSDIIESTFGKYKLRRSKNPLNGVTSRVFIRREVILPQIPGATTDPPAGWYYVESGEDFVFTIYPDAENSLLTLFATAGRLFDENGGGVTWTANEDGSYTVHIRQIQENVTISFGFATGNSVIDSGTRVWSHAGAIYTSAARDGEVRIYRLSGVLLKIIPLAAGETVRTPLPRGFYIIASGRDRYKVRIF